MADRRWSKSGQGTPPVALEPVQVGAVTKATTAGEDLYVLLESLPEQPVGPVRGWPARSDPVSKGDECLVMKVGGDWWFLAWDVPGWS
jgi:hypothetical protein